jgi:uncharacterized protein YueI
VSIGVSLPESLINFLQQQFLKCFIAKAISALGQNDSSNAEHLTECELPADNNKSTLLFIDELFIFFKEYLGLTYW